MEKNKIALVTYSLSSGGLERVVANSTFMFKEMGYDVHLYVLESKVNYPFTGKLHQFNIDQLGFLSKVKAYLSIKKSIKKNKINLILDHRYRLNWITEIMWQKLIYRKQNVFNHIHSSLIYSYLFNFDLLNRFLFKKRLFICDSLGIERKVNREFPFLKTQTIYNFTDFKAIEQSGLNLGNYILAIARMDHENVKQIDVLLECYAKSSLPEKKIRLIILGDGVRLEEMKSFAKELKISELVDFKGFIPNPENYLENALFTVLTSKYEGFGMVLIESLIMQTPVISFDCETGPNEIIINRFNGLLIENQNKDKMIKGMNELVFNEELYNFLKQNSLTSVDKFRMDSIKEKWEKVISDTP
ncbi:Glycosyltransferase involved in cell wall bisynthesis [Paenimyroides ummariense]|uniref:Glycosyltransferase involved in cell wall bisynthesis n=1 Tax=Paenimyroides ummariense TaxID=913024 RepID=A0A1I4XND4_9FLAO|nr:glycosyltransferase [Paenimyroides ummariense]SFN27312.1 Glycosyltransferase involved in cell wall bisynthesis [Paenimyroides ummariense]